MFFIIAIGCYGKYARAEGRRERAAWYAATLIAFVLGAMSKPMIVTLPFVLLLIDYWPLKRPVRGGSVGEKLPFFVLAGGAGGVGVGAPRGGGGRRAARAA